MMSRIAVRLVALCLGAAILSPWEAQGANIDLECPANISVDTNGTNAIATWTDPAPSQSETNGNKVTITISDGPTSPANVSLGLTNVTYTKTWKDGTPTQTCTFYISVEDVADPELSCADISFVGNYGETTVSKDLIVDGGIAATDNSGDATVTKEGPDGPYGAGTFNATFNAEDASGNGVNCTVSVTVTLTPTTTTTTTTTQPPSTTTQPPTSTTTKKPPKPGKSSSSSSSFV